MLSSLFRKFVDLSPKLSVKLWLFFYEMAALRFRNMGDWKYMNYGYALPGGNKEDNLNKLSENLYNHLFDQIDLTNKNILEVGCGRGGGCELVLERNPKSVVGIDFSKNAIRFCSKYITAPNLNFIQGNAEDLPFQSNSFEVIYNVESSHCYGNRLAFFNQVYAKLKPGGLFLYTDFMGTKHFHKRPIQLVNCGFEMVSCKEITANVLEAMNLSAKFKSAIISSKVPKPFRKSIYDFAGLPGSNIYQNFASRQSTYFVIVCRKPNR